MKKAVVLEIKDEYAAVMTDEGFVLKIFDENYMVGQEIALTDITVRRERRNLSVKKRFSGWYRAAAAAAAVFIISGSGLYYVSENVFAFSTVTVTTDHTSMELTLNKKNEVVSVKALDEKSVAAASELHISAVRRRPLSDTLDSITKGHEEAEVEVTVESGNEERRQKLEKEVAQMIPAAVQDVPDDVPEPEKPEKEYLRPEEMEQAGAGDLLPVERTEPEEREPQEFQPPMQNMGEMQTQDMPIQEGILPEGVKEESAPPESTKQEGTLPEGVEREKVSQEEMQQDRIPQNGQNGLQKEGIQNDSYVPEGAGPGNVPQPEMSREGSGPPPP